MASSITSFECLDPPVASAVKENFFLECNADEDGEVTFTAQPSDEFSVDPKKVAVKAGFNAKTLEMTVTRKAGTTTHAIIVAKLSSAAMKSEVVRVK